MIMILDMDVTAERRHYNTHCPLKGKRLTMICASLVLLQIMFAVHRFAQGAEGKVLKIDRPLAAGGFLSLTGPLAPRVVVSP